VGTQRYLLGKIAQVLFTLFFILTFNFFLFRIMPGDPVTLLVRSAGAELTPEQQDELRADLGLDEPIFPDQYVDYMRDTLTGNFGVSTIIDPGRPVSEIFWERMGRSFILLFTSTVASIAIGTLMGIYGGWRRGGRVDNGSMVGSMILYSMPEYVLGILLLLLFANVFQIFPTAGYIDPVADYTGMAYVVDYLNHMALPFLTLTLAYLGEYYLLMRSSLLDVMGEEFITLARAKGVREKYVLRRHAVRNALLPTVTLIALSFAFVLGGAITVELVFTYPGVGLLSYDALVNRDFPVLQGTFLFFSVAVLLANLIADLTYGYLDPRVRTA
jgi:peptide/nickel transport system permease protein